MALSISVAVMAHPDRKDFVDDLVARLDRPAEVVWDTLRSEWDTGSRAWEAHDPEATHHLVIQDDAVVCRDLVAGLEQAMTYVPASSAVSLYFGQRSPFPMQTAQVAVEADEAGASWLAVDGAHWGVALILPVRYIRPMLSWKPGERFRMYDQRISAWLATNRVTTFYPWPSLVDHRDAPSLLPGHGLRPGRVAHRFIGEDASALDLDGAGPVKHVGLLRRVRPVRPSHREEPMSATSSDLLIARTNAIVRTETGRRKIRKGVTTAHVDSWIVQEKPHLWEPIRIDYPSANPSAESGSLDMAPPRPPEPEEPAAKDVRAWAKGEGIDVPARGPLPDDIVARYKAAHAEG